MNPTPTLSTAAAASVEASGAGDETGGVNVTRESVVPSY